MRFQNLTAAASILIGFNAFALESKPVRQKVSSRASEAPVTQVANDLLLEIQGNIYPVDGFPPKCSDLLRGTKCTETPFGHFHVQSKKEGSEVSSITTFSGPEGIQVTERSWEKEGRVRRAVIENLALALRSELEVREGKVFYRVTNLKDGSVKTSEDDAEGNLVVPSTVMTYVRPSFQDLKAGKEVKLKVAVLDRRESFSFVMRKVETGITSDGDEMMKLEMAPVSFIVKALVDPMYFYVKPKTGELYAFEGRSALRRMIGDRYREMNVRTAYDYKINRYKETQVAGNCSSGKMIFGKETQCEVKAQ